MSTSQADVALKTRPSVNVAPAAPRRTGLRRTVSSTTAAVLGHYDDHGARAQALALSVALTYGGGAAMFWLHAIYRGEQGPPIANAWHWLLDSTLGFVALTPAVLLLVPLAATLTKGRTAGFTVVGAAFGVLTTPGPVLHNLVAGAGTPLARLATKVFGADPGVVSANAGTVSHSAISEVALQLLIGLPVYVVLATLVGGLLPRRQRATAPMSLPLHTGDEAWAASAA